MAEWFATRHRLRGAKALKATLNELIATNECYRELFWQPAAELMILGLRRPATMVRNASRQCASITDIDAFWPYGSSTPASIKAATVSAERKLKDYRSKAEQLLGQVGLGLDWLGDEDGELIQSADEMKAAG